jgi:hypothetical protein
MKSFLNTLYLPVYGTILLSQLMNAPFFLLYFSFKTFLYYSYRMILCDKKQIYFVNRPLQLLSFRQFGETSIQPIREDQMEPPHSMNEGNRKTYNQLLNSLTKLFFLIAYKGIAKTMEEIASSLNCIMIYPGRTTQHVNGSYLMAFTRRIYKVLYNTKDHYDKTVLNQKILVSSVYNY